jgi:hypothetical protein
MPLSGFQFRLLLPACLILDSRYASFRQPDFGESEKNVWHLPHRERALRLPQNAALYIPGYLFIQARELANKMFSVRRSSNAYPG